MPHGSRNKGETDKLETEIGGQSHFHLPSIPALCLFTTQSFFGLIAIIRIRQPSRKELGGRKCYYGAVEGSLSTFNFRV